MANSEWMFRAPSPRRLECELGIGLEKCWASFLFSYSHNLMDGAWKLSTAPDCVSSGYRLGEEEHTRNKMAWRRTTFPKAAPLPTHLTLAHYCFPLHFTHLSNTSPVERGRIFSVNKSTWINFPTCWVRLRTLGTCLNFSEPQFPLQQDKNNEIYAWRLWGSKYNNM